MKRLNKQQVLMLHSMIIKETGGIDGVRDGGLLESALVSPFQYFEDKEFYPSIQGKAARLCYGIIKNHPFVDGNKRTGILVMLVFLKVNNILVTCGDDDIIDLGLGIANGKYDSFYIMEWIIIHSNAK